MKLVRTKTLAAASAALVLAATPAAHAQSWVASGVTQASSGLEGGGGRAASAGRAQTRMRIGADLAVDESPEDVFGGAVLVAVEPRTAFGIDGRYTRIVGRRLALSGGVTAYLQPGSLVGPVFAFEYRHPLGGEPTRVAGAPESSAPARFMLTAGPEADVFVVGSDLPDKTVLWQALFHVGLRVSL